jgi:hypothetical protein
LVARVVVAMVVIRRVLVKQEPLTQAVVAVVVARSLVLVQQAAQVDQVL